MTRAPRPPRRMRYQVHLQPNVAGEMDRAEEYTVRLVALIESLQNRYAEIEKEQVALAKHMIAGRRRSEAEHERDMEARARCETEKRVLSAQLAEKRKILANTLHKLNALKAASRKSAENSRIRSITLQVVAGVWCIGPVDHALAKVSVKGIRHTQINDIERGVPVKHMFHITYFQIENLLPAGGKWNERYRQVLGPLVDEERNLLLDTEDSFEEHGTAMLAVVADQLAQKEEVSNQVVYRSMAVKLYPLNIQITEDLCNCMYAFVFPGDWKQDGSGNEWEDDHFHNIPQQVKMYVQKRAFYRLPKTSCRPHVVDSRGFALQRDASAYGMAKVMSSRSIALAAADDDKTPRTGGATTGAQKETRELEQLKIRARDNKEFQAVSVSSCQRNHDLAVSISYKGRGSTFPDIDALVIEVPDVTFPKDDRPLVCSWRELYDDWLSEVKWPIIKQATGNMWHKVPPGFAGYLVLAASDVELCGPVGLRATLCVCVRLCVCVCVCVCACCVYVYVCDLTGAWCLAPPAGHECRSSGSEQKWMTAGNHSSKHPTPRQTTPSMCAA